jgi:ribonuclease III
MTFKNKLGYSFKTEALLLRALTHKSFHHESPKESEGDNERLEFLGDAVIDLALSDFLMRSYPEMREGDLSRLRASLVNETILSEIAVSLGIKEVLRLGRGELQTQGKEKPRLLSSALEALVGAIYQDAGFAPAVEFVERIFSDRLGGLDMNNLYNQDFKTRLQEIAQGKHKEVPQYTVIKEEGPDHERVFWVEVSLQGKALAQGQGKSKKSAEQDAARLAMEKM